VHANERGDDYSNRFSSIEEIRYFYVMIKLNGFAYRSRNTISYIGPPICNYARNKLMICVICNAIFVRRDA